MRLFYNKEDLQHFFDGFQAKYWNQHGSPFVQISPEKCKEMVPELGKCYEQSSKNRKKYKLNLGFFLNVDFILKDNPLELHYFFLFLELCLK